MAIKSDWKTISLGELSWTLFWIAVAIAGLFDSETVSSFGMGGLVLFYVLTWFFGIVIWRFIKSRLNPKFQNDSSSEKGMLGLSWWNIGGAISNKPINGWFSAFIALWSISAFITLVGAFSFFLGLVIDLDFKLSFFSLILLFLHYGVLAVAMFYSLDLLIKKKAAAVPFTQILLSMSIASQITHFVASKFLHVLPEKTIVGVSTGGLVFIYYLHISEQIKATFPEDKRKLFWFDKLFLVIVGIFLILDFLGVVFLPDIAKFITR